jgi:hypothetical protein
MSDLVVVSPGLPAPVNKRRPRASAAEIADWAKRFAQSGLGQREFCQEHGLVLVTLQRWLERAQRNGPPATQAAAAFTEIKWTAPVGAPGSSQHWAVEVCRPSGSTLRLAYDVPPTLLEQLLRLC